MIRTAPFVTHLVAGHVIAQPVTRVVDNFDMLWRQADFFVQPAAHGDLRAFTRLDAASRKLSRIFAYAFTPRGLVASVNQDSIDIRVIAFSI